MESEGEDCRQGGTQAPRPDPATSGGTDRVYRIDRMSRRQRGGRNSRRTSTDWAKKHKRHPVVLPLVVRTRGVIPNQTVASLPKLKAWGFDMQVSRRQKAAVIGSVRAVRKTLNLSDSSRPVKDWQLPDQPIRWGARVLSV